MKKSTEIEDDDNKKKKKSPKKAPALSADEVRMQLLKKAIGESNAGLVYSADKNETIKDVIPTGLAELDRLFTPGRFEKGEKSGLPRGFIYEFYGPNSGGKSSICMRLAAQITKGGNGVFWIDAEGSFVNEWAQAQGVDLSKVVMVGAGKHGEFYLELIEKVARSGTVELIVVDSVTVMQPYEVMNGEAEIDEKKGVVKDARIGAGAKMMSRFMPKIIGAAKEGNTAVIFINQIRQKVGIVYGNPETTPYGEAIKFASSIRLRISRVTDKDGKGIKKDGEEIGIRSNVKLIKSRMGPPDREVVVPIYYDNSVKPHPLDCLIDAGLGNKIIKSRSQKQDGGDPIQTFTFEDIKVAGIDEFKSALEYEHIKKIFDMAVAADVPFEMDVVNYVKELGAEDGGVETLEKIVETAIIEESKEGDPGA